MHSTAHFEAGYLERSSLLIASFVVVYIW